jgi:hypothetical protein
MQLVDDAAGKLATGPLLVRPNVLVGIEGSRPAVDPARLPSGARIGQHGIAVVEQKAVVELAYSVIRQRLGWPPPAHLVAFHCDFDRRLIADLFDHQRD